MAVNDGRRLNRNPSKPTMNFGQGNYSPRNPRTAVNNKTEIIR